MVCLVFDRDRRRTLMSACVAQLIDPSTHCKTWGLNLCFFDTFSQGKYRRRIPNHYCSRVEPDDLQEVNEILALILPLTLMSTAFLSYGYDQNRREIGGHWFPWTLI